MTRSRVVLAAAAACCGLLAPGAAASPTQVSILQDDGQIIKSGPSTRDSRLAEFAALGVEVVKVGVEWRDVAPRGSSKPAGFDGADPAAYGNEAWAPYDAAIAGAKARGMEVLLTVSGPAPDWAVRGRSEPVQGVLRPDPGEFGAFVRAVGTRYSGSYREPAPSPAPPGGDPEPFPGLPFPPRVGAAQAGETLPRVSLWSVWNEPNLPRFLLPQRDSRGRPVSPHLYRGLYLAAHEALSATGHGDDTILMGELLPVGKAGRSERSSVRPLEFIRELACVDSRLRSYRGSAATRRNCDDFRALPGTGMAVHPYTSGTFGPPTTQPRHRDDLMIGSLSRLTSLLDRLGSRRRFAVRRRMPVWITEFGFQTEPPERFGARLADMPRYMGESEFIAYRNSRVRSFSQYPLLDDGDGAGFQSGLRFSDGRAKPKVYLAFELPLFARRASRSRVELFGGARAASGGRITIEARRPGGRFRRIGTARLNSRGYFRIRVSASGTREFRTVSGGKRSNTLRA